MSERRKKPVQYFFVDVNDPDYYKRIKVARACIDCRKRKSKCDIGKPGSGPCSSCRKHNKICEFTTTIIPSSIPLTSSSSIASSSSAQAVARTTTTIQWTEETHNHSDKRKGQQRRRSHLVSRHHRLALSTPRSHQADIDCNWTPHQLTLLPFSVDSNETTEDNGHHHNNNKNTSQSVVTQEDHHLVGHLRLNLPVRCVQKEDYQTMSILPTPSPPLLSSHPSSTSTTPSPPLFMNHANGATFQSKNSNPDIALSNLEISMHSVSQVDPVKTDPIDLFKLYCDRVHPYFPVVSKHLLKQRDNLPSCLGDAIQAVAALHHPHLKGEEYYTRAWEAMHARGNDLVAAQTWLVLYKYHETLGKAKPNFLQSAHLILIQLRKETPWQQEEWLCRLEWIVYLHQVNGDPPLIRLPCLLPCEHHDLDQVKIIARFVENIQMACLYTSAMQSLEMVWPAHPLHDASLQ